MSKGYKYTPSNERKNKSMASRLIDREKYNKEKEERRFANEEKRVVRREMIEEMRRRGRELGW